MQNKDWFEQNSARFSGELRRDEPLLRHTYYRIGGPATVFAVPKTLEDLCWLSEGIRATGIPYFILGLGSNVLVADRGYSGLVIRTSRLNLEVGPLEKSPETIRTGASVAISSLLRKAAQHGWSGLAFLTGIPGSVGGVVFMNGGTHLGEAKDRLLAVDVFNMGGHDLTRFERDALHFEYRRNLFVPEGGIVFSAEWKIDRADPAQVKALIDETLARRKTTQPIDFPSCGSVFKNPKEKGMSAWQVVDQVRLRGHRIGGAQIADKHSNFILNLGNATAQDVRALIDLAKERAQDQLGIALEEEVRYVGF